MNKEIMSMLGQAMQHYVNICLLKKINRQTKASAFYYVKVKMRLYKYHGNEDKNFGLKEHNTTLFLFIFQNGNNIFL